MSQLERFCFGCTPFHSQSAEIQPFYGHHRFATSPPICHFTSECFRSCGFLASWVFWISRSAVSHFLLELATEFQQFPAVIAINPRFLHLCSILSSIGGGTNFIFRIHCQLKTGLHTVAVLPPFPAINLERLPGILL